jgi:hypothetical protein
MIKNPSIVGFLSFWMLAMVMHFQIQIPKVQVTKQDSAVNFSQEFLSYFSLGQKRLLADILWVQTLIESDLDHYSKKDLNSWMFLRFNSIAKLDPNFYENYLYGGQYLSIVKDDIYGGEIILGKGVRKFATDFRLNFQLGFLYAFELQDYKKAQIVYDRIKNAPERPFNFDSFYGKLLNQSLGINEALLFSLESLKKTPKDTPLYKKIRSNIYSLRAQIDLKCLNLKNQNCNKIDYYGNNYIFKGNKYQSVRSIDDVKLSIPEGENE